LCPDEWSALGGRERTVQHSPVSHRLAPPLNRHFFSLLQELPKFHQWLIRRTPPSHGTERRGSPKSEASQPPPDERNIHPRRPSEMDTGCSPTPPPLPRPRRCPRADLRPGHPACAGGSGSVCGDVGRNRPWPPGPGTVPACGMTSRCLWGCRSRPSWRRCACFGGLVRLFRCAKKKEF
jgi:hypothetical protein